MSFKVPNEHRVRTGPLSSTNEIGNNGAFEIKKGNLIFNAIASDGGGWEHVSVTIRNAQRTPTWNEMCWIKELFWGDDDTVVQFHPAKSEYVNRHQYCLHLWRPRRIDLPKPETWMVG